MSPVCSSSYRVAFPPPPRNPLMKKRGDTPTISRRENYKDGVYKLNNISEDLTCIGLEISFDFPIPNTLLPGKCCYFYLLYYTSDMFVFRILS